MKHIIRKAYWNYMKEEEWLNSLSARGLALVDYSWCRYVFEETPPGEYIYRIELLDQVASHPTSQHYIRFVEETGVECVATYLRWVYFRKKAADGPFELHSDIRSRLTHTKRVRAFWLFFTVLELAVGAFNVTIGLSHNGNISVINVVLGALVMILGFFFAGWTVQMSRNIRRLKKELLIREG